jgi:hypothetical protein
MVAVEKVNSFGLANLTQLRDSGFINAKIVAALAQKT